jgi:hypothetical protein
MEGGPQSIGGAYLVLERSFGNSSEMDWRRTHNGSSCRCRCSFPCRICPSLSEPNSSKFPFFTAIHEAPKSHFKSSPTTLPLPWALCQLLPPARGAAFIATKCHAAIQRTTITPTMPGCLGAQCMRALSPTSICLPYLLSILEICSWSACFLISELSASCNSINTAATEERDRTCRLCAQLYCFWIAGQFRWRRQ